MSQQLSDPVVLTFHAALNAKYGSDVRQDLNKLTLYLRRLALSSCALDFLLHCRRFNVIPKFISNAIKVAHTGDHLARLVKKLPSRFLRAAIRDARQRLAQTQQTVDLCWLRLSSAIADNGIWNSLVARKDFLFARSADQVSLRLRRKFSELFFSAPDCPYTLPTYRTKSATPDPLSSSCTVHPSAPTASFLAEPILADSASARSAEINQFPGQGQLQSGDSESVDRTGALNSSPESLYLSASSAQLALDSLIHNSSLPQSSVLGQPLAEPSVSNLSRDGNMDSSIGSGSSQNQLDVAFCLESSRDSSELAANYPVEDQPIQPTLASAVDLDAASFLVNVDPLHAIPLAWHQEEQRDELPLAQLVWGANVPELVERDPRLLDPVVNLSGRALTTDQIELLSLGLRFRQSPKTVPRLKFMSGIEAAFHELRATDIQQAFLFRAEAARMLDKAKVPRSNLSKPLLRAAKTLRNCQDLTITSADKGGRTVVLRSDQYAEMCSAHLEDEAYEHVTSFGKGRHRVHCGTDPKTKLDIKVLNANFSTPDVTDRLLNLQSSRLNNLLTKLLAKKQILPSDLQKFGPTRPYSGVIPRFYGLPKLHKVGRLKIRPIISNYQLYCDDAMVLMKSILNLLPTHETSVIHSYELAEILDNFDFGPHDMLVSFDVQSLFTRVPVAETLVIVRERLLKLQKENPEVLKSVTSFSIDAIMTLLNFLLSDCYFIWADKLYRQRNGLPMGGHLSPVLAGIFMEELECKALDACPVKPRLYKRFVDDIFVVWDLRNGSYNILLDLLNAQHPSITLTVEEEIRGRLPFLDLQISRPIWTDQVGGNSILSRPFSLEVYRKPTHGNRYVNFHSAHPFSLKRKVFRGLWLRARRLLRNHPKKLALELCYLRRTYTNDANGYPDVIVRKWLRQFERELLNKPSILNLPKKISVLNQYIHQNTSQSDTSGENIQVQSPDLWVPTLVSPYVPGLSERMRSLAGKHGLRNWFSFGGKLSERLCGFKDHLHQSKSQFAVYSLRCECGVRYIGESARNLKVRVNEHKQRSSKSAMSLHVNAGKDAGEDHSIDVDTTVILAQERNQRKRRFVESVCIQAKSARVCNTGPSSYVSDVWKPALTCVAKSMPSAMD